MKLTIVSSNDWEGFYIDGQLIQDNHNIDLHLLLQKLGVDFEFISADEEWADNRGGYPMDLEDLKRG